MEHPRHGASLSIKKPAYIPAPLTASPQFTVSAYSAQALSAPPARPNPSLKRSANGRPPGPVWRYTVHFRQPGPGVLPSSPA
jgi:hypothetical protein